MKVCSQQGLLAVMLVSIAAAHPNYGQLLEKKVTLTLTNVPLKSVLTAIEVQAEVKFFYSTEHVKLKETITIDERDTPLGELLEKIFDPLMIRYTVHEKKSTVTLKMKAPESEPREIPDRDRSLRVSGTAMVFVSGTVTDSQSGMPMAGVNILIKGTTRGVSTSSDGTYTIEAAEKDVLVFSFIGFKKTEVPVGMQTLINVVLEEDVGKLSEVIVSTGYWETRRKESTGNIVKITSEEIAKQPVNNPILALQGRVAGLNVEQVSGIPGGGFRNLQIRGQNSLRPDGSSPLFVVDGIPYPSQNLSGLSGSNIYPTPLNILNPSDIESIEILKDADATAIYGSLGANGVILITTKARKKGTAIELNVYSGAGKVSNQLNLLNTMQYLEMRNEAFANDGVVPTLTNAPDLLLWDSTRYTDWQKELIGGSAQITNAYLAFSGGDESTSFLVGGGYLRETTVFPGNFPYQKGSLNTNVSHVTADQRLNISFRSNLAWEKSTLPFNDLTRAALTLAPNAPQSFDDKGELNWQAGTWNNPYADMLKEYESTTTSLLNNLGIGYELLPGVTVQSMAGYNIVNNEVTRVTPLASYSPASAAIGELQIGEYDVKTWIVEPQLKVNKIFGRLKLETLLGGTFRETDTKGTLIRASGFSSDGLIKNARAAANVSIASDDRSIYRYNAMYGRVGLNYNNKYLLNLTGRRDGSSRFGPDNRFANFGAIAAAWIFSNEKFFSEGTFLTFGKLRGSYGTIGNDQIGDYQYLSTYSSLPYPYQGMNPLYITRLANDSYQWEVVKKMELGLELGLLNDKISFSSYYYVNRSSNQLVQYSLPGTTGFTNITANLDAVIENRGWEFEVSSKNIRKESFSWQSSINITFPENKLVRFPNLEGSAYANTYRVGEPLNIALVYDYAGLSENGVYTFRDFDDDGSIYSPNDTQQIVHTGKDYFGGLENVISFKSFSLDFLFQFVKQAGRNYHEGFGAPGILSNQPGNVMERWTDPLDQTNVQQFTISKDVAAYNQFAFSDYTFVDASFIRLKNVSLSYQLPLKLTERLSLRSARVYIQAQNLFVISKYNFLDPETRGVLPPVRMITGGIHLTL